MIGKCRRVVSWTEAEQEEIMNLSSKSMLETSTPNDDIWRKFALPLTPPSSPRSHGESSNSDDVLYHTCNIAERLHDVCERLDSTFDFNDSENKRNDAVPLKSKLISDCMWSGSTASDIVRILFSPSATDKMMVEPEIDLYPTPCPSPPPSAMTDYPTGNECVTSSECVDPTTVFPTCTLTSDLSSSGASDSEEEIDVVTVDVKPLLVPGSKRRHSTKTQNIVVHAKVRSSSLLKRSRSSPAKFHISCSTTDEGNNKRKVISVTPLDDSEPESRRASHNVLERKRRIDLKNNFEMLRECVPTYEKAEKSPKVVVLKRAAMYIEELSHEEYLLMKEKKVLQQQKATLDYRIAELQMLVKDGHKSLL